MGVENFDIVYHLQIESQELLRLIPFFKLKKGNKLDQTTFLQKNITRTIYWYATSMIQHGKIILMTLYFALMFYPQFPLTTIEYRL